MREHERFKTEYGVSKSQRGARFCEKRKLVAIGSLDACKVVWNLVDQTAVEEANGGGTPCTHG